MSMKKERRKAMSERPPFHKDGSILECVVWQKPPAERSVESKKQPAVEPCLHGAWDCFLFRGF